MISKWSQHDFKMIPKMTPKWFQNDVFVRLGLCIFKWFFWYSECSFLKCYTLNIKKTIWICESLRWTPRGSQSALTQAWRVVVTQTKGGSTPVLPRYDRWTRTGIILKSCWGHFWNHSRNYQNIPETTDTFQKLPTHSRNYRHIPETTETFQKLPTHSRNYRQIPETIETFQKLPTPSRNYRHIPETTHTSQKLPAHSRNYPHIPETTGTFHKQPTHSRNYLHIPETTR